MAPVEYNVAAKVIQMGSDVETEYIWGIFPRNFMCTWVVVERRRDQEVLTFVARGNMADRVLNYAIVGDILSIDYIKTDFQKDDGVAYDGEVVDIQMIRASP